VPTKPTRDKNRIQSLERRCLRTIKGCTGLDHIKNEDVRQAAKLNQGKIK
jgi:hypothetical protein